MKKILIALAVVVGAWLVFGRRTVTKSAAQKALPTNRPGKKGAKISPLEAATQGGLFSAFFDVLKKSPVSSSNSTQPTKSAGRANDPFPDYEDVVNSVEFIDEDESNGLYGYRPDVLYQ